MAHIPVATYTRILCQDPVWVIALCAILAPKYGQHFTRDVAYLEAAPNPQDVYLYVNPKVAPMDRIARLMGITQEKLASLHNLTLKPVPFSPHVPLPNSPWGMA